MKNYSHSRRILIIEVIAIVVTVSESVKRDLLRRQDAVTSLIGSEDFYIQIKRIIPKTYVDDGKSGQLRNADYTGKSQHVNLERSAPPIDEGKPKEEDVDQDLTDKSEICARIFNRFLLEINQEYAVNFELNEEKTRHELYEDHRGIYNDIYAKWPEVKDVWLNPYKQRVVAVGGEKFQEHVFRCVTRKETSDMYSYIGYFVSPIYQLWTAENLFIDGRFLFISNDDHEDDELRVFAVAEESAVVNTDVTDITHGAYYSARKHRTREPDAESNVLCKLSHLDQVRLCAIALNAPKFPDDIRFLPIEASIEPNCKKKKVSASVLVDKQKWYTVLDPEYVTLEIKLNYNEWMIGCKAVQLADNNKLSVSTYYISRGLKEHTAIIFKASAKKNVYEPYVGLRYVLMARGPGTIKRIKYTKRKVKQ